MTKREKLWRGVWRGRGWGFFAFSSGSSAIPRARVAGRISSFPALVPTTGNPFPERSVPGPGWFYEMGDSREGEGGPDRVPLAHHEVRRSEGGIPVRAAREGRRSREARERGPVRQSGSRADALQGERGGAREFRFNHQEIQAQRPRAPRSRGDRSHGGRGERGEAAPGGRGARGGRPRLPNNRQGRPGQHAAPVPAVRRPLRVLQVAGGTGRDSRTREVRGPTARAPPNPDRQSGDPGPRVRLRVFSPRPLPETPPRRRSGPGFLPW